MAESKGASAHAKFVNAIVKDPASPPAVRMLSGFGGASHRPDHRRLYLDPELRSHIDFRNDAVLHEEPMSPSESPLGGSRVWVAADAELKHSGESGLRQPGVTAPICPHTSPPCIQPTPTATSVPVICQHTLHSPLCFHPTPVATVPCHSIFCPSVALPCFPPTQPPLTTPQFGGGEFLQGQMFAGHAPAAAPLPYPTHLGPNCTLFGPGCPQCENKPWPQPATPPGHATPYCPVNSALCPPPVNTQTPGCTLVAPGCHPTPPPGITHYPPACTMVGPGCPQCQINLYPAPATPPMRAGY
jgi:hypothetical protein